MYSHVYSDVPIAKTLHDVNVDVDITAMHTTCYMYKRLYRYTHKYCTKDCTSSTNYVAKNASKILIDTDYSNYTM